MAFFNGKNYIEPSTGSRIISMYPPTPIQLGAGTVAVIAESDAGLTASDGFYYSAPSDRAGDLNNTLRGGEGKRLCNLVFAPSNEFPGASRIIFVRAQAATRASVVITNSAHTFTLESYNKGAYLSDSTNGLKAAVIFGVGTILTFGTLVGGTGYTTASGLATTGGSGTGCTVNIVAGSGIVTGVVIASGGSNYQVGDVLTVVQAGGSAATFTVVTIDKVRFQLYLDSQKIYESQDITNTYTAVKAALEADVRIYKKYINTITIGSGGASEVFAVLTPTVFSGGTKTAMTQNDLVKALDLLRVLDVDVVYLGNDSVSLGSAHSTVIAHCLTDAETPRMCVLGGAVGMDKATAVQKAIALNSSKAVYVYPGCYLPSETTGGNELLPPYYTAAMVAGLIAGLAPQTPATYKTLAVQGFEINVNDGELVKSEREELITSGVTFCRYVDGVGFVINKAVTTTLANTQMINSPSGTSREVSIERIKNILNKELEIGSKKLFMGGNVHTVSQQDVVNYTRNYLQTKCATTTQDNVIIKFEGISAKLVDDAWEIDYGFYPNTPINHVFFTGAILRP